MKTKPLARAAKRREGTITLENMIFDGGKNVKCRRNKKKATGPEGLENESGGESRSG